MAEVLHISQLPERKPYFVSSSLRRSPHSSASLCLEHTDTSAAAESLVSNSKFSQHNSHSEHHDIAPSSPHSSTTSSPLPSTLDFSDSGTTSTASTTSGFSLEDKFGSDDEDVDFPDYDGNQLSATYDYPGEEEDTLDSTTTTNTTRSDSPVPTPTVHDDTAIKEEPSRHVDYLSHNWREEDIWSSWRHIVSQRRVYGQKSRLENASWRTWAKSKYSLRTVSPETLNWLKESDVTWLYGPLKLAEHHPITFTEPIPDSRQSRKDSSGCKKPILKNRSMSEVMLQRSISTTTLLKQAAASVQAQQVRKGVHQRTSDYVFSATSSEISSRSEVDHYPSQSESSGCSPSERQEERHIRFDDNVEQCIAVECKDGDFDEDEAGEIRNDSDASSDEGLIMMKRRRRPQNVRRSSSNSNSRSAAPTDRKTIETLPPTTLKYRTDSPDVTAELSPQQQSSNFSRSWGSSKLSPSPSQETLRPSRPSRNFLLPDDADDYVEEESSWSFGSNNPKSSLGASSNVDSSRGRDGGSSSRSRNATPSPWASSSVDLEDDFDGRKMRRTSSGMLMPYDEDEDEIMAVGLFGRVSETINTARDIAHVLWNVGWRK